tara:strand:+ start:79 stop:654 length:576 start_codon:yes stop_codon:yes gene_type:complete
VTHKKKVLFLGYNKKQTNLINFLRKKNINVVCIGQKKININTISKDDRLIVFGYRSIIDKKILKKLYFPPINLHLSYLPYNKGSHPNYWSFFERTPNGVTIHEVNKKLDSGKIIFQKKLKFKLTKKSTFYSTYLILFKEIEKLFSKNYKIFLDNKYESKSQIGKGTFHLRGDLPKRFDWKQPILKYLDNLK